MRRTPAECQYQVMMFAVLTQASFPFPPVVSSSPLQERAGRQTDRQSLGSLPPRLGSQVELQREKHRFCWLFWSISLFAALLWRNPRDYSRKWFCCFEYNLAFFFFFFFFGNTQLLAAILHQFFFFMSKVKKLPMLPAELLPVYYIWQQESSNCLQNFTAVFDGLYFSPPSVFAVPLLLPAWLLAIKDKAAKRRMVKLLQWFFFPLCFMYEQKWMKVSPAYFKSFSGLRF